jgi:hypothetical protein
MCIQRESSITEQRLKRETMSTGEAAISNMWEMAAIVELLEQKGFCTKQDLHTIIDELRRKNPRARIPETAFPESCSSPKPRTRSSMTSWSC